MLKPSVESSTCACDQVPSGPDGAGGAPKASPAAEQAVSAADRPATQGATSRTLAKRSDSRYDTGVSQPISDSAAAKLSSGTGRGSACRTTKPLACTTTPATSSAGTGADDVRPRQSAPTSNA